jgi:hypothetical protein
MAEPNERETAFQQRFRGELNQPRDPGENRGPDIQETTSAYEIKAVHDLLPDLADGALKELRIVRTGSRLDEGAVYYDLAHPERGEFRGMNDMTAEEGCYLVPKSDTGYDLWNWVTGKREPVDRINRLADAA